MFSKFERLIYTSFNLINKKSSTQICETKNICKPKIFYLIFSFECSCMSLLDLHLHIFAHTAFVLIKIRLIL